MARFEKGSPQDTYYSYEGFAKDKAEIEKKNKEQQEKFKTETESSEPVNNGDAYFNSNLDDFQKVIYDVAFWARGYQTDIETELKKPGIIGLEPKYLKASFLTEAVNKLELVALAVKDFFALFEISSKNTKYLDVDFIVKKNGTFIDVPFMPNILYAFDILSAKVPIRFEDIDKPELWQKIDKDKLIEILTTQFQVETYRIKTAFKKITDSCSLLTIRHFLYWYNSLRDNVVGDNSTDNQNQMDWEKFVSVYYRPAVTMVYKKDSKYNKDSVKTAKQKEEDDRAVKDPANKQKVLKEEKKKTDPNLEINLTGLSDKEFMDALNRIDYKRLLAQISKCISAFTGVNYAIPELKIPSITPYSAPTITLPKMPVFDPSGGISKILEENILNIIKKTIIDKIKKSMNQGEYDCKDLAQLADKISLESFKHFMQQLPFLLIGLTQDIWEGILQGLRDSSGIDFCLLLQDFTNTLPILPDFVLPSDILDLFDGNASDDVLIVTRDLINAQIQNSEFCQGIYDLEIIRGLFYDVAQLPDMDFTAALRDVWEQGNIDDYAAGEIACVNAYQALADWLKGQGLTDEKIQCLLFNDKEQKLSSLNTIGELITEPETTAPQDFKSIRLQDPTFKQNLKDLYDINLKSIFMQTIDVYRKYNEYMLGKTDNVDGSIDIFGGLHLQGGANHLLASNLDSIKKTTQSMQGYLPPDPNNSFADPNYGVMVDPKEANKIVSNLKSLLGLLNRNLAFGITTGEEELFLTRYAVDNINVTVVKQRSLGNGYTEEDLIDLKSKIYEDGSGSHCNNNYMFIRNKIEDATLTFDVQKLVTKLNSIDVDNSENLMEFAQKYNFNPVVGKNFEGVELGGKLPMFVIGEVVSPQRVMFAKLFNKTGDNSEKMHNYFKDTLYNGIWKAIFFDILDTLQDSILKRNFGQDQLMGLEVFGLLLKNISKLDCVMQNFEVFNFALAREKFVEMFLNWYPSSEEIDESMIPPMGLTQYLIRIKIIDFMFKNMFSLHRLGESKNIELFDEIYKIIDQFYLVTPLYQLYDCFVFNKILPLQEDKIITDLFQYEFNYILKQFNILVGGVNNSIYSILIDNIPIMNFSGLTPSYFDALGNMADNNLQEEPYRVQGLEPVSTYFYRSRYTMFYWNLWGIKNGVKKLILFPDTLDNTEKNFCSIKDSNYYDISTIKEMSQVGLDYCVGWFGDTNIRSNNFHDSILSKQIIAMPELLVFDNNFIQTIDLESNVLDVIKNEIKKVSKNSKDIETYLKVILRMEELNSIILNFMNFIFCQYWNDEGYSKLFDSCLAMIQQGANVNSQVTPSELEPLPESDTGTFAKANNDNDTFGIIKAFLAETPIQKMAAQMAIDATKLIFKSFVESSDPNIKASRMIVDGAKIAGQNIPIVAASLGMLLPVNIAPLIGWGPPITPAGLAYLGLETLEEQKSQGSTEDDIASKNPLSDGGTELPLSKLMQLIDDAFSLDRICAESSGAFEPIPTKDPNTMNPKEIEKCQNLFL